MRTLALLLALCVLAVVPLAARADDAPAEKTKNVNLVLHKVDVIDALTKLATLAGENVIVSPKVKGQVTLEFNNTPFLKALEQVAAACGCVVQVEEYGLYTVVPKGEAARGRNFIKRLDSKSVNGHVQRVYDVRDLVERNFDILLLARQGAGKEVSESTLRAGSLVVRALPAAQKKISESLAELREHLSKGGAFDRVTVGGKTMYFPRVAGTSIAGAGGSVVVPMTGKDGLPRRSVDPLRVVLVRTADGKQIRLGPGLLENAESLHRKAKEARGEATPATGKPALLPYERLYTGRRALRGWKFTGKGEGEGGYRRGAELASKAEAICKQAVKFRDAAVLLKAAGDEEGAERAFQRATSAYAAAHQVYATAQRAYESAKKKEDEKTAREKQRGTKNRKSNSVRSRASESTATRASINGLRAEVRALRGEVRELTGLVRQLLEK